MDSRPPAYNPNHDEKLPHPIATTVYPPSSLYPQMPTFPQQSQQSYTHKSTLEPAPPPQYYSTQQPQLGPISNSHPPSMYPPQFPLSAYQHPATTVVTTTYPHYPTGYLGYVFQPTKDEIMKKAIEVKYSPSLDLYYRPNGDPNNGRSASGWKSWVYSESEMFRKVEEDHKKTYLARNPGANSGRIEWRFTTEKSGKRIKSIKIKCGSKTFKTGVVKARVETSGEVVQNHDLKLDSDQTIKFEDAHRCTGFSLISEVSGGKGNEAWQHAQLFPQALKDHAHKLEVLVKLD